MLPMQRTEYSILLPYNFCKSGIGHMAINVPMNKISNLNILSRLAVPVLTLFDKN